MIEICCVVIAIATVCSAIYLKRIAGMMADNEKREKQARRIRELAENPAQPEPLPPRLKLTAKDLEETDAITARRALETERLFKPKPTP